jgi:hypothetical protein
MGIKGIKEVGKYFTYIHQRGIIYIIIVYFKGSVRLIIILRLLRLSGIMLRLY